MPFLTLPRIIGDFASYLKTRYELQSERGRAGSRSPATVVSTSTSTYENLETVSVSPQARSQTQSGTNLAPGWYVVCTRRELKRLVKTKTKTNTPKDIQLFGQSFTLFCGEKTGRPYLVSRFCPHQGASLTRGKVIGDSIRCEFHHWQFAGADGACTFIPTPSSGASNRDWDWERQETSAVKAARSRKARIRSVPLVERNGMLFAWYPGDGDRDRDAHAVSNSSLHQPQTRPDYELPVLVTNPEKYYRLGFTFHTRATPRRILENLWDADHIPKLHGLPVLGDGIRLEILSPETDADAFDNRTLTVAVENWFAIRARARLRSYIGVTGRLAKLLGVNFDRFALTVEACPTLGVATIEIDGVEKSRNVLAITPIRDGYTLSRLVIYIRKTGSLRTDLANLLLFGLQNYLGGLQDVMVWNHLRDLSNAEAVATAADKPFYLFRRFYARASTKIAE
jgi:aminopyrrolnitrin oxygenase